MPGPLFRESALQKLSSPEQLDQLMPITRPRAWIALCAIAVILVAAILWSIFGSLPTSVVGQGLITRTGGVFDVLASGSGSIAKFTESSRLGDRIRKGQVIATVSQPALEMQVAAARAEVDRLAAERKEMLGRFEAQRPAQARARALQAELQEKIIRAKEEQLRSLRTVAQQHQELLRDGLITGQRVEETRQAMLGVENEIGNARNTLLRLELDRQAEEAKREESVRDVDARMAQAQDRLDDLEARLRRASSIVAPLDGSVVEVMAGDGDTVKEGQPVMSLESGERRLTAVLFLPPMSSAELIRTGMGAQVSPVTAKKERYGYLLGKVTGVGKYPATEAGMMSVLNNQALVRELSSKGPPIAVQVELVADPATKSGYAWSSAAGAAVDVRSGTSCIGTVVVERKRPISLVIPLIRETLGL